MARFAIEYNNTRKDLHLCVAGRGHVMSNNGPGRPQSRLPRSKLATSLAAIDCYPEECQDEPWFVVDKLQDPVERDLASFATYEEAEAELVRVRKHHGTE